MTKKVQSETTSDYCVTRLFLAGKKKEDEREKEDASHRMFVDKTNWKDVMVFVKLGSGGGDRGTSECVCDTVTR